MTTGRGRGPRFTSLSISGPSQVDPGQTVTYTRVREGTAFPVTVQTWTATAGSPSSLTNAASFTWTAPNSNTSVTIRFTSTDADGTLTASRTVTVGTGPAVAPVLPSAGPYTRSGAGNITQTLPAATSGDTPITYSVSGSYTSFDAATRQITVALTNGQSKTITYTATNSAGSDSESVVFSSTATVVPVLPSAGPYTRSGAGNITQTLPAATSGDTPITYSVSGSYTSFNASTRQITVALTNGQSKTITYTATNSAGSDSESVSFSSSFVSTATAPDTPAQPTLTVLGTDSIEVSYTAPNNNGATITSYTIRWRVEGSADTWETATDTASPYTISGLDDGVEYEVQVSATNSAGSSGFSSSATVTTTVASTAPATPATPTLSALINARLEVTYTAPDDGGSTITGYTIRWRLSGSSDTWETATDTASPYIITNLAAQTEYEVQVSATNAVDSSGYSASATATTTSITSISLSDFDDDGLEVEAAALIERTASGDILYADSDRGGTDSPEEGELGLGDGQTLISRIRKNSSTTLLINDNNNPENLGLNTYFLSGGEGHDLTLWIQTIEGVASIEIAGINNIGASGGNYINFVYPPTGMIDTLLSGISVGDDFIIAFTRPDIATELAASASGTGNASLSLRVTQPSDVTITPAAASGPGNASLSLRVTQPSDVTITPAAASGTGNASLSLRVTQPSDVTITPAAASGTGNASLSLNVTQPSDVTIAPATASGTGNASLSLRVTQPSDVTIAPATASGTGNASLSLRVTQPSDVTIAPATASGTGNASLSLNVTQPSDVTIAPATASGTGNASLSLRVLPLNAIHIAATATGNASLRLSVPLRLSDFDDENLEPEILALIVAAQRDNVFQQAPRTPARGTLLAGAVSLGAVPVTRILIAADATLLSLVDSDTSFHIGDYFSSGAGNDLAVYIQTTPSNVISFPVAGNISIDSNAFIRFSIPSEHQATLDSIQEGDRFIIALARAAPVRLAAAASGPGNASLSLRVTQPSDVTITPATASGTGNASLSLRVTQPGVPAIAASASATGNASLSLRVTQPSDAAITAAASGTGNVSLSLRVTNPTATGISAVATATGNAALSLSVTDPTGASIVASATSNGTAVLTLSISPGHPSTPTLEVQSGQGSFIISWDAPGGEPVPDSYDVQYGLTGGGHDTTVTDITATSYTVTTTLSDGEDWYAQVLAKKDSRQSVYSPQGYAHIDPPNAPDTPRLNPSSDSIAVNWDAPTPIAGVPITDYRIWYRIAGIGALWSSSSYTPDASRSFRITGLDTETEYEVEVQARNVVGPSVRSSFPTATATTRQPEITYELLVDWDGDGQFNNAYADIFPDIVQPVRAFTGRDLVAQRFAQSVVGKLEAVLNNAGGGTDPANSAALQPAGKYVNTNYRSPLFGLILPNRLVQLNMVVSGTTSALWTGYLDDVRQSTDRQNRTATLTALGPLSKLTDVVVDMPVIQGQTSSYVVTELLDAAGLDSAEYDVNTNVASTLSYWYPDTKHVQELLSQVELWELGLIRETRDGKVRFDGQNWRGLRTSSYTFTDQRLQPGKIPLTAIRTSEPQKNVANTITLSVEPLEVGSSAVQVWTGPDAGTEIEDNDSLLFNVIADLAGADVAVTSWESPVVGTDYYVAGTAGGAHETALEAHVTVNFTSFHDGATLTFTRNGGSGSIYIRPVQLSGTLLSVSERDEFTDEDEDSITLYRRREYPKGIRFISTQAQGEYLADLLLSSFANPTAVYRTSYDADISSTAIEATQQLNISDKVGVEGTEESEINSAEVFLVEAIEHVIGRGRVHNVDLVLTGEIPLTGGLVDVIVLGTGPGLGTGRLGR